MTVFATSRARVISLALISSLSLALAACGGGGGGSSAGSGGTSNGNGGGLQHAQSGATVETCDGGSATNATAIAPCVTVSGLASGQSVTVYDGLDSLTETSDGTYNFPALAFVPNGNGGEIAPTLTFSVTAGSCSIDSTTNSLGGASYHITTLCAAYPAVSPTVPTVTTLPGVASATVIGTPDIVPVMFQVSGATSGNQANDVTFLQQLTASKVWGLLNQYGVGGATVQAAVVDTTSPGFSLSPFSVVTAQDISNLIQAQASTWAPMLTGNTVFVIFLPPNVMDTYGNGAITQSGMPNAAGLTGQVTVSGTTVTYALVEDTTNNFYQSNSVIYEMTEIALVNAVTNPTGTDGYAWLSANPDAWLGASNGVLGDVQTQSPAQGQSNVSIGTLCTSLKQVAFSDITVGEILPIWSQTDANAGRSPCQPAVLFSNGNTSSTTTLSDASTPFYGVVPQTSASATGILAGVNRTDDVVQVSPGQSVTVDLEFFSTQKLSSDVSVAPTVVSYITGTATGGTGTPGGANAQPVTGTPLISVSQVTNESRSVAGQTANNGDMLQVTITASGTPFTGMYVIEFGGGVLPLAVTEGSTWQ